MLLINILLLPEVAIVTVCLTAAFAASFSLLLKSRFGCSSAAIVTLLLKCVLHKDGGDEEPGVRSRESLSKGRQTPKKRMHDSSAPKRPGGEEYITEKGYRGETGKP